MATQNTATATSPKRAPNALVEWANQESGWLRTLVGEVLRTKTAPLEQCINDCLDLLLREKGLRTPAAAPVPLLPLATATGAVPESLRLTNLHVGDGVNALKPGQGLEFGPSLTVVFGENGSGKSGYVRVLKRIAGVRAAEPILSDINKVADLTPTATIEYTAGVTSKSFSWKNEQNVPPFTQIAVFDSRAARVHVDELTYSYTPADLGLFQIVHDAIQTLETSLRAETSKITAKSNPFTIHFKKGTSLYPLIETLGAASDLGKLGTQATFTEENAARKEQLEIEIAALKATDTKAQIQVAEDDLQLSRSIESVLTSTASFDREAYLNARSAVGIAEKDLQGATAKAFEGSGIPGVLQDPWIRFIQAGEQYLTSVDDHQHYPDTTNACLYCRQPLASAAVDLIRKYRDFASGDARRKYDEALAQLRQASSAITRIDAKTVLISLTAEERRDRVGSLASYAEALRLADELREAVVSSATVLPDGRILEEGLRTIQKHVSSTTQRIADMNTEGTERDKHLTERINEFEILDGRAKLHELWPAIEEYVSNAKWVDQSNQIQRTFQGIRKSVTDTSKSVAEELLNTSFGSRFVDECKYLRVPPVQLNFPGQQGQPMRRKLLAKNKKPSEVWSEGEQKALALADFIAETSVQEPAGPVVFDDPINSLDYRRIGDVAGRVLWLASHRQVIVFTHNIWFVSLLIQDAEKKGTLYYDIKADEGAPGILSRGTQPRLDTFADQRKRLEKLIEAVKKADPAIQEDIIRSGYSVLRGICETVTEQEMFNGVSRRFEPNVSLQRMDKIKFATLEDAKDKLLPIFEKACRYTEAHSQPAEQLNVRPTLTELAADWAVVSGVHDEHKK
jgi:hypothetical protein